MPTCPTTVIFRSAGTALVLDVSEGELPRVLHWGSDPGGTLDEADINAMRLGIVEPIAPNAVDVPVPVALLPQEWAGWSGRPGLSGSRAGVGWAPRFEVTDISLDGSPVKGLVQANAGRYQARAVDPAVGLAVVLDVEFTTTGIARLRATVTNTADDDYQLDDLVLALPVPTQADEVFDLAGRWGKERAPQRSRMTVGTHLREGRRGRTGADAALLLHLGEPGFDFARGEIWAVHTGWSGNHTHYAERLASGAQVIGGGELLLPGEVVLGPGGSYTSPWLYAAHGIGLDAIARRFHRLLRARPQHPSGPRPVTLNVWEAVYFDHDLPGLLELADQAAALGVERFVLDDGWFGSRRNDLSGLGDWVVSKDVWPDGLHPLVDHVRGLGMQFGLWIEPEMVNPDSDLARAHPEWIMATGDRLPIESRFQQVVNLGIPDCYEHIRSALFALLDEYDIGYFKWDHNRDLVDAANRTTGRPGVHEQTLATYRLFDELREHRPGLEIESCSSGGGRVDLGILERADRVWVSDVIDPLERQQMNRWTTQLVPPEMLGSHVASGASHTTGRTHDLSFRAGTAVFGHFGIEWDLRRATDAERAELGDWIRFYQQHRDLLHGGDLVRIDHPDASFVGHGVVAPDRRTAIYSIASVAAPTVASIGRIRFPGLDPDRRYRVRPVLPGHLGNALMGKPPLWWNVQLPDTPPEYGEHHTVFTDAPGVVLSGGALGTAGLAAALLRPEHTVLYTVEAV